MKASELSAKALRLAKENNKKAKEIKAILEARVALLQLEREEREEEAAND